MSFFTRKLSFATYAAFFSTAIGDTTIGISARRRRYTRNGESTNTEPTTEGQDQEMMTRTTSGFINFCNGKEEETTGSELPEAACANNDNDFDIEGACQLEGSLWEMNSIEDVAPVDAFDFFLGDAVPSEKLLDLETPRPCCRHSTEEVAPPKIDLLGADLCCAARDALPLMAPQKASGNDKKNDLDDAKKKVYSSLHKKITDELFVLSQRGKSS